MWICTYLWKKQSEEVSTNVRGDGRNDSLIKKCLYTKKITFFLLSGYASAHKREANANHQFVPDYKPDGDYSMLMIQDYSSLYGYCMTQHLPYSMRWAEEGERKRVEQSFLRNGGRYYTGNENIGYFLEVDLDLTDETKMKFRK